MIVSSKEDYYEKRALMDFNDRLSELAVEYPKLMVKYCPEFMQRYAPDYFQQEKS